jgi:hypothetical protein
MREPASGNFRIRIFYRSDDTFDASLDERVRTRPGAPLVRVRLKRDISCTAASLFAGLLQSHSLGVLDLIVKVEALANYSAARIDYDCANQGAGTDFSRAARRKLKRPLHHLTI